MCVQVGSACSLSTNVGAVAWTFPCGDWLQLSEEASSGISGQLGAKEAAPQAMGSRS